MDFWPIRVHAGSYPQLNLNYLDSLGLGKIVSIIKGPGNLNININEEQN